MEEMEEKMTNGFQQFCRFFPGDSFTCGKEIAWIHCQYQDPNKSISMVKSAAQKLDQITSLVNYQTINYIENTLKLREERPASSVWFDKVIQAYTSCQCSLYNAINWNLRTNEHWNVQEKLSPFILGLRFVCEGGYNDMFKNNKFKPFHGRVYRGTSLGDNKKKQIAQLKKKDQFYFSAFTSTSQKADVAKFWGDARKRAKGRRNAQLTMVIDVDRKHRAGVAISHVSEVKDEDEVLLSCYTRFEVVKIKTIDDKHVEMHLKTVSPFYKSYAQWKEERTIRDELGQKASIFEWKTVLRICKENRNKIPNLVNSTRPASSKFYTALHQASWQRNDNAINSLKKVGANPNCWNYKGKTPLEVYNS